MKIEKKSLSNKFIFNPKNSNDFFCYQTLLQNKKKIKKIKLNLFQKEFNNTIDNYSKIEDKNYKRFKIFNEENKTFHISYNKFLEKNNKNPENKISYLINSYRQKNYKIPKLNKDHNNIFKPNNLMEKKLPIMIENINSFPEINKSKSLIYLKKLKKNVQERIFYFSQKKKYNYMDINLNINENNNYHNSEKSVNTNYSNSKTEKNEINYPKSEDEKTKNENEKIINDIKILLNTIKKTDNEYKNKLLKLNKNNDLKKYNSTKDLYKNKISKTEINKIENRSEFLEEAFEKFKNLEFDEVYKLLNLYLKKFKKISDKNIEKYLNKFKQSPPNFLLRNINNINNLIKKQNFQEKIKKLSNFYNLNYEDKIEQIKKNEIILSKFENLLIKLMINK